MRKHGTLTLITGPTGGGKTEQLLTMVLHYISIGKNVLAVKFFSDSEIAIRKVDCISLGEIRSDSGLSFPCLLTRETHEIVGASENVQIVRYRPDVVAIDDVHFFGKSTAHMCKSFLREGVDVVAAGINLWFDLKDVQVTAELLDIAASTLFCYPKCKCGALANVSVRLSSSTTRIDTTSEYMPMCHPCRNLHYISREAKNE